MHFFWLWIAHELGFGDNKPTLDWFGSLNNNHKFKYLTYDLPFIQLKTHVSLEDVMAPLHNPQIPVCLHV